MNRIAALILVAVCLIGSAVAITLVWRRAGTPTGNNSVNPNAIDVQKRRVVERISSNEQSGSVRDAPDVGVSTDIMRDWAEYQKSPGGGAALQSIVRGAAQPNVSSDARFNLVKDMLELEGTSEDEQEKRTRAAIEIAESTGSPELIIPIVKCYPRLSSQVKSNTIARIAIIDIAGFMNVAIQIANSIDHKRPDEIKALNDGMAMMATLDKGATQKFFNSLSPEVRNQVDPSFGYQ